MINPVSGYNAYAPYSMNPVSAVSGRGNLSGITGITANGEAPKTIKNPNESNVKSAGRKSSPAECETCASRKYNPF